MIDAGTGEMTTLTNILNHMNCNLDMVFAFDMSLSRIFLGRSYKNKFLSKDIKITEFCAEISKIPLPDNSVDTIITIHSLEPNKGRLSEMLREMFRISKSKILLFEPYYEMSSNENKKSNFFYPSNKILELDSVILMSKFYSWIIRYTISKGLNPDEPRYLTKVTQTF